MKFKNYRELDREVDRLYLQGKYPEAAAVLEQALIDFPEEDYDTFHYLAVCRRENRQYRECIDLCLKALEKGHFYYIDSPSWKAVKNTRGYDALLEKTMSMREEMKKMGKVRYEVYLPDDYRPDKKYPLVFILHGNGNDLEITRKCWQHGPVTKMGCIAAYIQSSQIITSKGYSWTEDYDLSDSELKYCFEQITEKYSVNRERYVLAGFSGGAMGSLHFVMNDIVPVKGFIVFCAKMFDSLTPGRILEMKKRGVKGVVLEGEWTKGGENIREIIRLFEDNNYPIKVDYLKNTGHWYAEAAEMGRVTAEALEYVLAEI